MDENRQPPLNKRLTVSRWLPAWLWVCLTVGAAVCVACWFAMDRLSGKELAFFFGAGFTFMLVILSSLPITAGLSDQDTIVLPPRWLRLPIIAALLGFIGYVWLKEQLEGPAPPAANIDAPAYVVWLLWVCAGWFGLRLLWIGGDMVRALWAGGQMHTRSLAGLITSIMTGAAGGFLLVVFLWPSLQAWSWHQLLACAAVLLGAGVGLALDCIFILVSVLLLRRLLAWRLPHDRK